MIFEKIYTFIGENRSKSPPKKKKKLPKILDGNFYTVTSSTDGKIEAKCIECNKIVKGSNASTGNFKIHYKTHGASYQRLETYLQTTDSTTIVENSNQMNLKQTGILHHLPSISISEEQVLKSYRLNSKIYNS